QVPKSCGKAISNRDGSNQGAGDFPLRMTRARHEVLDQKRGDHQNRQNQAPEPPGDMSRWQSQRRLGKDLEKKHTDSDEDAAAQEETGAEDQGDTILGALEANQDDGGEHEGQQATDDLEIALQEGVRGNREAAQPVSGKDDK